MTHKYLSELLHGVLNDSSKYEKMYCYSSEDISQEQRNFLK